MKGGPPDIQGVPPERVGCRCTGSWSPVVLCPTVIGGARRPKWNLCDSCTHFGASESIFKISHTNRRNFERNPDHLSAATGAPLHLGRRVYERGHRRQPAKGRRLRAHNRCREA